MSDNAFNATLRHTCEWCGVPFRTSLPGIFCLVFPSLMINDTRYCSQMCHEMAYKSNPEKVGKEDRSHKTLKSVIFKTTIITILIMIPLLYFCISTSIVDMLFGVEVGLPSVMEAMKRDPLIFSLIVGYFLGAWIGLILGAIIAAFKK